VIPSDSGRRPLTHASEPGTSYQPVVSIVTVTYNHAKCLGRAVDSVASQSYPHIQYIVVDNASKDGTLEIIQGHRDVVDAWVSEADSGIYDAMNKGIALARGEWLLFLGADDELAGPRIIEECVAQLRGYEESHEAKLAMAFGEVVYSNGYHFRSRLGAAILLHNTIHHQAALYSRALFRDFRYDTTLKRIADYELNLIVYQRRLPVLALNRVIARCQSDGQSGRLANRIANARELDAIRKRHVPFAFHCCLSAIIWVRTLARLTLCSR
jgi:glycosyltransferase involved in cell wall biosynthesis